MHILPTRKLSAAANMAVDQLLLEAYLEPDQPRFRHYEWNTPTFTFGRTQRWTEAETCLPMHPSWREAHDHFASKYKLVRRSTGGGVVDHRDDWTYSLVIPTTHALAQVSAGDAYREVHNILAWALRAQEVEASLVPCPCTDDVASDEPAIARNCFQRPEPGDVIDADGVKLAGAAQRRTRNGMLMQGSIDRITIRGIDWRRFESDFSGALAEWLGGAVVNQPFPKWPQGELTKAIAQYESKDWNQRR
ncbi:lipoate--protein ligase family protein [Cerasicoccus arenae]|uniref:BPL/LPL catalytic domain-containing protein n=1 Tax=Cerasicoccus arenae TaxID=424488 RepID=A0A8J3GFD5_9BACT|nr:lipoate--protein ligase family protein [Cerasicoccus arenae]MBK1858464.1 hypothetical protein [Cerasicoccus arenae]GHC10493.1 hypothetical protein GCM10007047_29820 [Cerasicoccus arenae]